MKFLCAICPKCQKIILVPTREPFVRCVRCEDTISASESLELLETWAMNPARTTDLVTLCLELEDADPNVPLEVLRMINAHYPENEHAAYLIVRFTKFNQFAMQVYLQTFCNIASQNAFAEQFLENCLTAKNMPFADEFKAYIDNKLPEDKKSKWRKKLAETQKQYVGSRAHSGWSLPLLYIFYAAFTIVNLAAAVLLVALPLKIWQGGIVLVALFMVEVGALYAHNKYYGNRLYMEKAEKLLMTIFMSSAPVVIGALFVGLFF